MEMEAFICGACSHMCEVPTRRCACGVTFAGLISDKQWAHEFYNKEPKPPARRTPPAGIFFNGEWIALEDSAP